MADETDGLRVWGRFRFAVIAELLVRPPKRGKLQSRLEELADRTWEHPVHPDERVTFGKSTIERWYYTARDADDPVAALCRKVRRDKGQSRSVTSEMMEALGRQYRTHPNWSYQLHYDNLCALCAEHPELSAPPTYATIRRHMKNRGWTRRPMGRQPSDGKRRAMSRRATREVRSYEVEHAHALWHLDFHTGSLRILDADGQWRCPILLAILDDHSRLICHLQWFFAETAQVLVFGLKQALLKWGLPRALMSDNGSAMIAGETTAGLETLGVSHRKTLAYSPYQNGKQETFWSQIEGRLLPMLQHKEMDLAELNPATIAWAELEYNRSAHQELDATPLERLQQAESVSREAPSVDVIDLAFTRRVSRQQRRSDGTITLDGVRFDVPSRLRMLERVTVRYATWDLSKAHIVDPETDAVLARIRPLDKRKHADGRRAVVEDPSPLSAASEPVDNTYPPLMRQILARWAQTGLPPAFIPMHPDEEHDA